MQGELLHPGPDLSLVIEHVAIGAMQAEHVLERVGPGSLLIVPGDREDIIGTMVSATLVGRPGEESVSTRRRRQTLAGVVLTGGYRPSERVIDAIRRADIFTYLVAGDSYARASEVHDLLVKTHPDDAEKIELIQQLVADKPGRRPTADTLRRADAGLTPPSGGRAATWLASALRGGGQALDLGHHGVPRPRAPAAAGLPSCFPFAEVDRGSPSGTWRCASGRRGSAQSAAASLARMVPVATVVQVRARVGTHCACPRRGRAGCLGSRREWRGAHRRVALDRGPRPAAARTALGRRPGPR